MEKKAIPSYDDIFGINCAGWECSKEDIPAIQTNDWQEIFRENPADSYCIYQLRKDPQLAEIRFMNANYLCKCGLEPSFDNYEAVYSGILLPDGSIDDKLDDLYMKFNTDHPRDFIGHSLSVSDVIVLRQNGVISSYYVDSVGFVQMPAFLPDNYFNDVEMTMEDNCGMLDDINNNGKMRKERLSEFY